MADLSIKPKPPINKIKHKKSSDSYIKDEK